MLISSLFVNLYFAVSLCARLTPSKRKGYGDDVPPSKLQATETRKLAREQPTQQPTDETLAGPFGIHATESGQPAVSLGLDELFKGLQIGSTSTRVFDQLNLNAPSSFEEEIVCDQEEEIVSDQEEVEPSLIADLSAAYSLCSPLPIDRSHLIVKDIQFNVNLFEKSVIGLEAAIWEFFRYLQEQKPQFMELLKSAQNLISVVDVEVCRQIAESGEYLSAITEDTTFLETKRRRAITNFIRLFFIKANRFFSDIIDEQMISAGHLVFYIEIMCNAIDDLKKRLPAMQKAYLRRTTLRK